MTLELATRQKTVAERQKRLVQLIKLRELGKAVNAYDLLPSGEWIDPTEMYVDSVTRGSTGLIKCLPTFTFKIWLWHYQEGLTLSDLCLIFQAMQRPALVARMRYENDHMAEFAGLVNRALIHRRSENDRLERERAEAEAEREWANKRPELEALMQDMAKAWQPKTK